MKKLSISILTLLASTLPALAQSATSTNNDSLVAAIVIYLVLGLSVVAIGHMSYVLFIRRKLNENLTESDMIAKRQAAGLPAKATDFDNANAEAIITEATDTWTTWTNPDGSTDFMPLQRTAVKKTAECYDRIMKIMPTDPETIDNINALATVTNYARKRVFTASKTMLIVLWVVTIAFCLLADSWGFLWLGGINTVLYVGSTMKPNYVLVRRDLQGKTESSFLTGIIGGLFAGVAAAPVYRTVTTYSDGSKSTSDDHSATFFALAFTLVAMIVLSIFLFVVAIFNYLRNYVFA